MLETEIDIVLIADEVQRACDVVARITAAKRTLSLEIGTLEKRLTKAYETMKGVTDELAEAVETMARATRRLSSVVRKPARVTEIS